MLPLLSQQGVCFVELLVGHETRKGFAAFRRVAFESDRLGYSEVWACDSEGSNCAQLTPYPESRAPHDGRRTANTLPSSIAPRITAKYIFLRWVQVCLDCCPPYRKRTAEDRIGRETESGFTSTPTEVAGRFKYGRSTSTENHQAR